MFKAGDKVVCINSYDCNAGIKENQKYTIKSIYTESSNKLVVYVEELTRPVYAYRFKLAKGNYMKEMLTELKSYVKDNKNTIYTVLLVALLDHYFLEGKLRGKLQELLDSVLNKAKKQLDS